MKYIEAAFLSAVTVMGSSTADAMNLRKLFQHGDKKTTAAEAQAADEAKRAAIIAEFTDSDSGIPEDRSLKTCPTKWFPTYTAGWAGGYCKFTTVCNSAAGQGFSTQLACCKGAYAGQTSGNCIGRLPSPPTGSPTDAGGLDVYYPDYSINDFANGHCKNERPMPNGWPTYSSELACCKGAYAGQTSGKCVSMLESPPTTSPTNSDYETDFFYPVYEENFVDGYCSNKLPLPFNNKNDRPNYDTMLACCKGAYGGQVSGKCISMLDTPPTTSPTASGGWGMWIADRTMSYENALCTNVKPDPYIPGARKEYDSQLDCCKGNYPDQASGACLNSLASPPTDSPTTAAIQGTGTVVNGWYPVRTSARVCDTAANGGNINEAGSDTKDACCTKHYLGETNCACDVDVCSSCDCAGASTVACATSTKIICD